MAGESQHPPPCSTELPPDRGEPAAFPALWSPTGGENQELKQQKSLFALTSEIVQEQTPTALLKGYLSPEVLMLNLGIVLYSRHLKPG